MITETLKQVVSDSGCTIVIYEQRQIVNLRTDIGIPSDIIGVIVQPDNGVLEVHANSIQEHWNPLYIEVLKQITSMEEPADDHEAMLQTLLDICKQIITRLIITAEFKKVTPVRINKIVESKYDANLIGWVMTLDLYYLENRVNVPC